MVMMMIMTRMNGAVPLRPCMLSQRADPLVLYASLTTPYVFYDAMLLLAPKIRQYSAIYYHYIGHSAYYKKINVGFILGTLL